MLSEFKDLLNQISCGDARSVVFTQSDLDDVKACIPEPVSPISIDKTISVADQTSCINDGIDKIKAIYVDQASKQSTLIELCTVKAKVQEALDHYKFIRVHFNARVKFFNDTVSTVEPFTSQYLYWNDESVRLRSIEDSISSSYLNDLNNRTISLYEYDAFQAIATSSDEQFGQILSDFSNVSNFLPSDRSGYLYVNAILNSGVFLSYYNARKPRIVADTDSLVAKDGATKALASKISDVPQLNSVETQAQLDLLSITSKFSGQLIPHFSKTEEAFGKIIVPARTAAYGTRIIGLSSIEITVPQFKSDGTVNFTKKTIDPSNNQYVTLGCFGKTLGEYTDSVLPESSSISDYSKLTGDLYNGSGGGYVGLYKKLQNPIETLYTLDERGLSVDQANVDPILKSVKDAPITVKQGDLVLYISSQGKYTDFYQTLQSTLSARTANEIDVVFPTVISSCAKALESFAISEVADQFRRIDGMQLKLARPVSYVASQSSVYSQGKFTYDKVDTILSSDLMYYTQALSQLDSVISNCNSTISNLSDLISQNQMDEKVMTSKISQISCFDQAFKVSPTSSDCESKTSAKLGIDPLILRTMDGNDATMPDLTSSCYWKEFAKSLNKIAILPIPDTNSPIFRYYPVNNLIPTPAGITLVTLPQVWTPLFVLPTALGTLVTFLTMPIAVVGIPLPSIYSMFLSPDGNKYMLFAPNVPILYSNPFGIKYGFKPDFGTAVNPATGLNGPYSGNPVKGALSVPLSVKANSTKAARLAKVAADLAIGKTPTITSRNGTTIGAIDPTSYLAKYISLEERAANGADRDVSKSFDKQISKFKRNINRQLDRLGPMSISSITGMKDSTRTSREDSVTSAESIEDSKARRLAKIAARKLDPIKLDSKISGVLSDFERYIDKIKLGTIRFPDDPTVINPKLPGVITGAAELLEQATKGGTKVDGDSSSLTKKIRRLAGSINTNDLSTKRKSFDLNKSSDLIEFKGALKNYLLLCVDHLQGNKSNQDTVNPNLSEKEKIAIANSNNLRKKRLTKALAFTSLSLTNPSLKLFSPGAPCCPADEEKIDLSLSPQVKAAISVLISLFDAYLEGLTLDVLRQSLGDSVSNVGLSTISAMFNSIIGLMPDISLPSKPNLISIVEAIFVPIVTALTIPQSINPLGLPFPTQIVIPLDALIKPLLKAAVAYLLELVLRLLSDAGGMLTSTQTMGSPTFDQIVKSIPCGNSEFALVQTSTGSNTVTVTLPNGFVLKLPKIPTIPLDLIEYFVLLTSTDLVELIRSLIMSAIDGILLPLKEIIDPILNLVGSLKDLSFTVLEAANPFILPIKLIMMAIQLKVPSSTKIKIANFDAIDAIRAAYIPLTTAIEPVLRETSYLATVILCALGGSDGVELARVAANPFFNQDDLPPWERLTQTNPLFAIFLDEIAWRSSLTSTGTLLFQTKMPGLYPTAWSPSIFVDQGALSHVES